MSDKIIDFRSRKPIAPESGKKVVEAQPYVDQETIEMLRDLLRLAEAGDIAGVAVIARCSDDLHWLEWLTSTIYSVGDSAIGRLEKMKHLLIQALEELDEMEQEPDPVEPA